MTLVVEFNIEDEMWSQTVPWYRELALRAAEQALAVAGRPTQRAGISVLLCDDARITALNATHRRHASATNVLSWPAHDLSPPAPGAAPPPPPDEELGDVAMARETIESEAKERHISTDAHFAHLFAHGVLHLLGYDHQTDDDAELMQSLERRAMAAMGIADPYAETKRGGGADASPEEDR